MMIQRTSITNSLQRLFICLCAIVCMSSGVKAGNSPAQRIVSIGSAVTEIIYALGEEARLIARDTTSTYPKEAQSLPDVGYMRALSAEGMLSTDPDLVILMDGSGPQNTLDVIKATSVPITFVPESYSVEGIITKIKVVGRALNVDEKARILIEETKKNLKTAISNAHQQNNKPRVLFILSSNADRLTVAGQSTGADAIITLAGGSNIMKGFHGYKPVTPEALLDANPDLILMMDRPGLDKAAATVLNNQAIALTPAGQNKALIRMDGSYLLGFGPRTAQAISELSTKFSQFNN